MMAVQQRVVPAIEEVLISDSEDDDVVIVDDDKNIKLEKTNKDLTYTIDYENSSKDIFYNNGDFEHLPQLFANGNLRKTEEIYYDDDYEISDASNHSSNEVISTTNVNSSDKENVPVQDSVRIESNDRNADSDDDRFYIAEDCNAKDVLNHPENNEKMDLDVDVVSLSNDHKGRKANANGSSFKGELKKIDIDSLKHNHLDADANKLVIDETTNGNEIVMDKSRDMKLEPEELIIETSSDDDSEDAQDGQVIIVSMPYPGLRMRMKRFLRMYCKNCDVSKCVPKLYKPDACICKLCESILEFKCKTCSCCFETYSLALSHLKRECASKYFWHCPECEYAVRDQSKFDLHIQKAHANNTLRCPHCHKIVYNQKTLDKHIMETCIMKAPRFQCNSCDFKDRLLSKIKKHVMMSHCVLEGGYRKIGHRTKKYTDDATQPVEVSEITNTTDSTFEPKVTEEKLNIERLIKLHCIKCKITFKKTADIGTKCKYCNSSLLYQCKMCKERSKSLCGIYDHLDNNCEFVICKQCNNRFKTKADAIKHKETCGRVLFKCKYCNYRTKQKNYLQIHTIGKHYNENITAQK